MLNFCYKKVLGDLRNETEKCAHILHAIQQCLILLPMCDPVSHHSKRMRCSCQLHILVKIVVINIDMVSIVLNNKQCLILKYTKNNLIEANLVIKYQGLKKNFPFICLFLHLSLGTWSHSLSPF